VRHVIAGVLVHSVPINFYNWDDLATSVQVVFLRSKCSEQEVAAMAA
jgi:hypothetical protein